MGSSPHVYISRLRWGATRRRALLAALIVLSLMAGFLRAAPARAAEAEPVIADRESVVAAWRVGGAQVRSAAEAALVASDDQIRQFLESGWQEAQRLDERDAVTAVISDGGPSVRAAAERALTAAEGGDQSAVGTFLNSGWQTASAIDTRLRVNQVIASGGDQVRQAGQAALDSEDATVQEAFLESGWQVQWQTDQRLRVNQAMATGGPQVRAEGQKALDAGTPEALEQFLEYGWAVASARDDETVTLTGLLVQAQAAGELAAQETKEAREEADRARDAADAARRAAATAARATEAAKNNTAQAAAHAKRAAIAAQKAAMAAKVAIQAAAAANRAARAAATAASRAAAAASRAGEAATKARKAAAAAAGDATKASEARRVAEDANRIAGATKDFATKADQAGKALEAGLASITSAKSAITNAKLAADANDDAARAAGNAGADASDAIAAANRARANAERANRAVLAAEKYMRVAIGAAFAARDAALRAAANAQAAALAAIDAADHAGDAANAARRATENAEAATVAATQAVEAANQAYSVFDAARLADDDRLAAMRDDAIEAAQAANAEYEAQRQVADWDVEQTLQRSAETNRLIALVQNPATDTATAVLSSRKVALALTAAPGAWTKEAALAALSSSDDQSVQFVRTGIAQAAAEDDRMAVMDLSITDNSGLATAAKAALGGTDAQVTQFLRTQNYPGRFTQDRLKVNQILSAATAANDVVLAQRAQQALDSDNLQVLRDFLDSGQYTAAAVGQRVRVNNIMNSPTSGKEVKAAAQVALDGPPMGLQEFLNTGQFTAAERDQNAAVHLAVVGGLLEKINEIAQTATKNALEAQSLAARARGDANKAADYANQAAKSAEKAAQYATKAQGYANQAAESADKASKSVKTARSAATKANASARQAVRSAAWAINSHATAVDYAEEANAQAKLAYESAKAAGKDANAAAAAAQLAYDAYQTEKGAQIAACYTTYYDGPSNDLEKILSGTDGEWARNCMRNVVADPAELARRAYTNSAFCGIYPDGSQLYQNCIQSTLDPAFTGLQPLTFMTEAIKGMMAMMIPIGIVAGIGCVVTVVCGAAAGTLLTMGEVGLNIYKLINGDQSLAKTLLNLGTVALESLLLAGIGKVVGAGFRAIKALDSVAKSAKQAEAQLKMLNLIRVRLGELSSCVRHSFDGRTPVLLADGSYREISRIRRGDLVRATDPITGTTTDKPVTKLWQHQDTALTNVRFTGKSGTSGTVRTTANHLFWSESSKSWVRAADLGRGSALRATGGAEPQVASIRNFTGAKAMYDLTVQDVHTYYVAAAGTPVLVHNALPGCLAEVLKDWTNEYFKYGPETFILNRERMVHILTRHHPKYWAGRSAETQTFFDADMSVDEVRAAIRAVMLQNRDELIAKGSNAVYQIEGTYGGKKYVLGINRGTVGQFYPLPKGR